jgi:hypothetical protein
VPQISGAFDSDFWSRLLLQASYHEPCVRHAIIALGALHEQFESGEQLVSELGGGNKVDSEFALRQYVKSLGHLLEPVRGGGRQKADVALMTCVLFICFEVCVPPPFLPFRGDSADWASSH